MNTTSHAKLLDRKEKARKSSLQWLFTDRANDGNCVHHISDRRDVGVRTTDNKNEKNEKTKTEAGSHQGNKNDGLLGSLFLEHLIGPFMGAAMLPLIPSILEGIHLSVAADMTDEFWMDRRKPSNPHAAYAEQTYFPL